jgi:hypothetical protein
MNTTDYIKEKQDQLVRWEQDVAKEVRNAANFAAWKKKRDDVVKMLETLKTDTGDRVDVLKMGFESAWDELKAAFETATSDLHPKH